MSTLVVTNASGGATVILGQSVGIGGSFTFSTFHNEEYLEELRRLIAAGTVTVEGTLSSGEAATGLVVEVDHTANPGAGVDTAVVGFQVKDKNGVHLNKTCVFSFGAYMDTNGVLTSAGATFDTATAGTILSGVGVAPEVIVVTDGAGKFTCTLTETGHVTDYLKATLRIGSVLADVSDVDDVTFTP